MKKVFLFLLLSSFGEIFSQKSFLPGFQLRNGFSKTRFTSDPKPLNPDSTEFKLKPGYSFGLGFTGDWHLNSRGGLSFTVGIQQMRSVFKNYPFDPPPRYEFNYIDMSVRLFVYTGGSSKVKAYANFGIAGGYLFSGWRVYDTGSDLITDDLFPIDLGIPFDVGIEIELKRKDFVRIGLSNYLGLKQIFTGDLSQNGLQGKNGYSLITLGYILGKRTSEQVPP